MPEKRRRTQLNYKTISRCALTNKVISRDKVIRYANVETQTSPAVVVGKLYVALERVDDEGAQGQSSNGDDSRAPSQEPTDLSPDGRASVALNDTEKCASLRVSLPLTLLTSQEKSPARAEVNNSEDEGGDSSDAGTSLSLLGSSVASLSSEDVPVDDPELQGARAADSNNTAISLSSNASVTTSGEEPQSDAEFDLEDKRGLLSILFPDEKNTPRDDWVAISGSNRNAEDSGPIEEEEKEDEDDDGREDKGRKRQRKRLHKYLRVKANIVHIHNHFYGN